MGIPVLIMGESGAGKSTSLREFADNEIGVLNVATKMLPFRNKLKVVNKAGYSTILKALSKPTLKRYAIDDSQYLMVFETFNRAKETGYGKFTDIAVNFYNLIKYVIEQVPEDVIVYFMHHTSTDDYGKTKAKTIGKMIDSTLTLEGLFSIVILCEADADGHWFVTKTDGQNTVKTPMGMFTDEKIPNDLKMVDKTIREYYGLEG